MPFPLYQKTKRVSTGVSFRTLAPGGAAYAVPLELNIDTSGGRPTTIDACDAVHPFRNARRDRRVLRVMTAAIPSSYFTNRVGDWFYVAQALLLAVPDTPVGHF